MEASSGRRGLALAGGGPLGAIYEIGALVALDEALDGCRMAECDVYVGVSSGGFFAAGLANGMTPREMFESFIENTADDPFEPWVNGSAAQRGGVYGARRNGLAAHYRRASSTTDI